MKWIWSIVGVILTLIGIFWILQGTGIVPLGFMSRHSQWAIIGSVLGIMGIGLIVYVNRRPGNTRSS
jgi:hypothetical protein